MRDLKRYPITVGEIEKCLLEIAAEISKEEAIGDMRPLLLKAAARIVLRSGFVMHNLQGF